MCETAMYQNLGDRMLGRVQQKETTRDAADVTPGDVATGYESAVK